MCLFVVLAILLLPQAAHAQLQIPQIPFTSERGTIAASLQLLALITILSLAPAILVMMTSFTRLIIVLSFVRHAIGTQSMPPNQVLVGLALFLTFFIMAPVAQRINKDAIQPYIAGQKDQITAFHAAEQPLRSFMLRQTRQKDLGLFVHLAKLSRPRTINDIPTYVIIPSFIISELKTAFQMGFMIFLPFLVIDMVVSSILMSMGMMMLPPIMISLPFKLILFVLVDGWHLLARGLVQSFVP
ncbi:MAG: flagellar type III secretion system pore protein FliP [Cyanobacteria bacterium NC_groundwater_1444_Ag_S-0.65um_54_12]|nr:flagellar type III secretion system pore protein FliP [Cyanobacteria bacterium NC_groundwater_1444_Ag_S-0.65um_54_12]